MGDRVIYRGLRARVLGQVLQEQTVLRFAMDCQDPRAGWKLTDGEHLRSFYLHREVIPVDQCGAMLRKDKTLSHTLDWSVTEGTQYLWQPEGGGLYLVPAAISEDQSCMQSAGVIL